MGRMRGCLWLTAGLAVALLAAVVGYMALSRATATRTGAGAETTQVDVVVAEGQVPVRAVLTAENLRVQRMAGSAVPEGTAATAQPGDRQDYGRGALPRRGDPHQRLVDPNVTAADGRTALVLDGDRVLIPFPRRRSDEQGGRAEAWGPRGPAGDARLPGRPRHRRRTRSGTGHFQCTPEPDHRRDCRLARQHARARRTRAARGPRQNTADANAPPALLLTVSRRTR